MTRLYLIIAAILTAAIATIVYRALNKGLSSSSKHQQLSRLSTASLIAMAPWIIYGEWHISAQVALMIATCVIWSLTYPLIYHLSNRKVSSDYDNQIDIAFGLYSFGAMSATYIVCSAILPPATVIIGISETAMLILAFAQWIYYILYKTAVDFNGMTILQATHVNEIFEFAKSFNPFATATVILSVIALSAGCIYVNLGHSVPLGTSAWIVASEALAAVAILWITFVGRKAPWKRCGIINLYLVIRDYRRTNSQYTEHAARRIKSLDIERLAAPASSPGTIMLVIGESANRDYMSAITPLDRETTPWLSSQKGNPNFLIFPNAYSCAGVTVQALERALTERNQYNDKPFYESVSIIDVAHKLGYKVHWYSNQGHLGSFDTPVTLVADTADVAKWTHQELNKVRYDSALLDFLDEIDPAQNNLVVLHLKGSHFNFLNRYPQECTVWGKPGVQDNILNYMNSIRYTDDILRRFYEYGIEKLNMQAMVYFSDHATIPERTRTPGFMGFGMTRIPLFIYLSDDYIANHPQRATALRNNVDKHFTNDLAYELICGIFDIRSDHFDERNSLASEQYIYTRDMLKTYDGTVNISDDNP